MPATRDTRQHPRFKTDLEVKVSAAGREGIRTTKILNISLGGVFVATEESYPFGTELNLEFSLPGQPRVLKANGVVMWTSHPDPKHADVAGIGVRLKGLSVDDIRLLRTYLDKLR